LQVALEDKPHPKPNPKLNEEQEAHLVAVTCSSPPAGHARWTLELLQERLIQDGIVSGIAPETVRLLLTPALAGAPGKNKLKPWLVKIWCIPEVTAAFLSKMEHILWLYALPDDLLHPQVCFDEKSIQLLAQTRKVIGCSPGQATRQDYEYKRNDTRNLFMFVAPKRGERNVLVTNRRTKIVFAQAMSYLVGVMYPEAEYINLVMDNLNTHHYHIRWWKPLARLKQTVL
jgi:hypothetical protein